MKFKKLLYLPLFILSIWSCQKEEIVPIKNIALSALVFPTSFFAQEPQEIFVQITTGTPCYSIEVIKTVSGNIYEYNFILTEEDTACIQVVKQHEIPVVFSPPNLGTYTLRFLINGELHETREIVVTENSLLGTWQVLRFEDETQNTVKTSSEDEKIVLTFNSLSFNGTTARNEFQGEYQIPSRNEIFVTEYLSTEEEETEFGKLFYEAMRSGQLQPLSFEASGNLLKIKVKEGLYMILSKF